MQKIIKSRKNGNKLIKSEVIKKQKGSSARSKTDKKRRKLINKKGNLRIENSYKEVN